MPRGIFCYSKQLTRNGTTHVNTIKFGILTRYILHTTLTFIIIGLLSVGIFVYSNWSWQTATQKHLALIDNITYAKVNVIKGHLWFEEFMGGDTTIHIEEVWILLNEAIQALNNAREGKSNTAVLKDISIHDQKLSDQLDHLKGLTQKFHQIAEERWKTQDTSGIGSSIDQHFDKVFVDILHSADVSDALVHLYINTEITKLKRIHFLILSLWIITISGMYGVLHMHSRKRLLLEASIKKLTSAIEHNPCTIIITNPKGKIEYVNPKFTKLTGYTWNEAMGKTPRLLKSGETPPNLYKELWENITSGRDWNGEFCNRKKNGDIYWEQAYISSVKDKKGAISHYVAVKEDITERKETMEALLKSEEKLQSILDNTTAIVYVKDIQGKYLFINKQFEKLFHLKRAEVLDKTAYDLWPKEKADTFWANDRKVIEGKGSLEFDEVASHEDGQHTYISVKFPLFDSRGAVYAVCNISTDITHRKHMENVIRQMAYTDALTSLPNRILFKDRLVLTLSHARRNKEVLAVLFIDIDQFKEINDTLGHSAGDKLLQCIAARLKQSVRDSDTVSRFGGDEFNVLLPSINHTESATSIADKIVEIIKQPVSIDGTELFITASIGIAFFPDDGEDAETLLKHADVAMYQAKQSGRNNYKLYRHGMHTA